MKILRYTALALLAVLLLGCSKTDLGPITREQALLICNGHAPPAYPEPVVSRDSFAVPEYMAFSYLQFSHGWSLPPFKYYGTYQRPFPRVWREYPQGTLPAHYCYLWQLKCPLGAPGNRYILGYWQYINAYTGQLLGWIYDLKDYS